VVVRLFKKVIFPHFGVFGFSLVTMQLILLRKSLWLYEKSTECVTSSGLATIPKGVAKWRSPIRKSRLFWRKLLLDQEKIEQTSLIMLYGLAAPLSRLLFALHHLD